MVEGLLSTGPTPSSYHGLCLKGKPWHNVPPKFWIADALSVSNCWATDKIIVIYDWDWKGTDPVILRHKSLWSSLYCKFNL